MSAVQTVRVVATHSRANAAAALLLGAYLVVVLANGNLGSLAKQAKYDFITGDAQHPAFWRWGVALLILYSLSRSDKVGDYFAPLLWIALVAMFVWNAQTNSQAWTNLRDGIAYFYGMPNKSLPIGTLTPA